jgi:hypothetical protein
MQIFTNGAFLEPMKIKDVFGKGNGCERLLVLKTIVFMTAKFLIRIYRLKQKKI